MANIAVVSAVVLFFITAISAYIPFFVTRIKDTGTPLSVLNCAAGGVVLGVLLIHMIPDIIPKERDNYPFGAFFAGVCFIVLYGIDFFMSTNALDHGVVVTDAEVNLKAKKKATKMQSIIFLLALSVHSYMEGLGLDGHSNDGITAYLIGIFAHKWLEAFALGVSILNAEFPSSFNLFLIILYSCLTPLGIVTGMIIPRTDRTSEILNGLAAGSFLFVACVEMIPKEFHVKDHVFLKYGMVLFGFFFMSFIAIFDVPA